MCGITGSVAFREPPDPLLVAAMASVIEHRGPDEKGAWAGPYCALAMNRLAIQDVAGGHQPVFNSDRSVVAVMNGELYNFASVRARLEQSGSALPSRSDTEIIPPLYERHGDAFLEHIDGMFAIALWDATRERLLIARDRFGKKPLFWTEHHGEVRFASEIKALFADRAVPREPDLDSIHNYLCLQYVRAPMTAFQGIHSLPPGHKLIVDRDGARVERWWELRRPGTVAIDRADAASAIRAAVDDAVRVRMVADVPLGAFLSGGVDSACVVASMSAQSTAPVRTFTIGFDDGERDERAMARTTARALGTDHTEEVVTEAAAGLLPLLAWHYDQPFADHSAIPTYLVARETRRHVTVALNGDGGDEAFAGYARVARLADGPPGLIRRVGGAAARMLPEHFGPRHPLALARRAALRFGGPSPASFVADTEIFPEPWLLRSYTPAMAAGIRTSPRDYLEHAYESQPGDPVWQGQHADYTTYLPGALLPKVDIATMAVSLEARSPFLDHHLVELAASLLTHQKVGQRGTKLVLRDAFRGTVPDAVLDGPKRGFGVPLDHWFQGGLGPMARALLLSQDAFTGQVLRREVVERLLSDHERGRARHGPRIYSLIALELWQRAFIAAPPVLTPPSAVTVRDLS